MYAVEIEFLISGNQPQVSLSDRIKQQLETLFKKMNVKKLFAPSTIGAVLLHLLHALSYWCVLLSSSDFMKSFTSLFLFDASIGKWIR